MSCRLRWYLRRSIPRGRGAMRLRRAAPASSPLERGSSRKAAFSARHRGGPVSDSAVLCEQLLRPSASDSQAARAERPGAFAAARSCARKPFGFGLAARRAWGEAVDGGSDGLQRHQHLHGPRTPAVRVRNRAACALPRRRPRAGPATRARRARAGHRPEKAAGRARGPCPAPARRSRCTLLRSSPCALAVAFKSARRSDRSGRPLVVEAC